MERGLYNHVGTGALGREFLSRIVDNPSIHDTKATKNRLEFKERVRERKTIDSISHNYEVSFTRRIVIEVDGQVQQLAPFGRTKLAQHVLAPL